MSWLVLKALHIIGVVAWFAGLFYIVRLFVYLTETAERPAAEREILEPQLKLMARRLWFGITWPAGLVASAFGLSLLYTSWPPAQWLQLKLVLVVALWGYHGACHWIHLELQAGRTPMSSTGLRVWNEVATLFLVSIVFLAVLKDTMALTQAVVGLAVLSAVLIAAIAIYRRLREPSARK